jgi:hypothetical protein
VRFGEPDEGLHRGSREIESTGPTDRKAGQRFFGKRDVEASRLEEWGDEYFSAITTKRLECGRDMNPAT